MTGFEVKTTRFRKVQGATHFEAAQAPAEQAEMIVKVKEAGYVPAGLRVRARVNETMFTAEASSDVLPALEADPKVESVSISRRLRVIE